MTIIPTDILRAIYTQEQPHRIDWPKSYAEGMADPIISRVVEMLARVRVPAYRRQDSDRCRPGVWSTSPPGRKGDRQEPGIALQSPYFCDCAGACKGYLLADRSCKGLPREQTTIDRKSAAAGERQECVACDGSGSIELDDAQNMSMKVTCPHCDGTGHARKR